MIRHPRKYFLMLKNVFLASAVLAASCVPLLAQNTTSVVASKQALPPTVERMLAETNIASIGHYHAVDNAWRAAFGGVRDREKLKEFVSESVDIVEKLRQVYDIAANPGATEVRIEGLFQQRVLNSEMLCNSIEKSLSDFCQALDDQDQALLIKLKIDRQASRTKIARTIIDSATYKAQINAVVSATVKSVQNDLTRSILTWVATEAVGSVAKKTARDWGLNTTKEGSFADFLTGLIIEVGVGYAVDAVTDPKPQMVSDLEAHLQNAERAILDGNGNTTGFLTTLRRITDERIVARRKLIEAELAK